MLPCTDRVMPATCWKQDLNRPSISARKSIVRVIDSCSLFQILSVEIRECWLGQVLERERERGEGLEKSCVCISIAELVIGRGQSLSLVRLPPCHCQIPIVALVWAHAWVMMREEVAPLLNHAILPDTKSIKYSQLVPILKYLMMIVTKLLELHDCRILLLIWRFEI